MPDTFSSAAKDLRRLARGTEREVDTALQQLARSVARSAEDQWPVDTGESAAAWEALDLSVQNLTPYVSNVHDGLADRLLASLFEANEPATERDIDRRLRKRGRL